MLRNYHWMFIFLLLAGGCSETTESRSEQERLYVGTFSVRGSKGVYVYAFDRENRRFSPQQTVTGPDSPSFLDISPDGKFLYTANRQGIGSDTISGSVSAYGIDPDLGQLSPLNEFSSFGISPCHIYADGRYLYLSHYAGGSISVLSVGEDGQIDHLIDTVQHHGNGPNAARQEAAHLHSIQPVPHTPYFLAADLGTDQLTFYEVGSDTVTPAPLPAIRTEAGAGPRHFTFSPDGRLLYVAEELTSNVSVYEIDADRQQTRFLQRISTLPEDFREQNTVADIHLSPDGRFLYVSNRGHESLAIFAVGPEDDQLSFKAHQEVFGKTPRNFMIDPRGTFLLVANEATDEIVLFERDQETGLLRDSGVRIAVPSPVTLAWKAF